MSEHSTGVPEPKQLQRSRSDRILAGVCGGLAAYFEIQPAVFRVAFVVLALIGGSGILIYLAAALVMPDEGREDSIVTAALRGRRGRTWPVIGLGLVAAAGAIVLSTVSLWPRGDAWVFLLVAGIAILVVTRYGVAGKVEPPAASALVAPGSRRVRRLLRRLAIAFAALAALLLIVVAVFTAVFDVHYGRGIGERSVVVERLDDLRGDYRLGLGKLSLDLRSVALPAGETRVEVSVDVGELKVIVPDDVALRVRAGARLGEIELLGKHADGNDAEAQLDQTGDRVLLLDAHVGLGAVVIERALR